MATDLPPNDRQQPQAWTCIKCGAALPADAGTGKLVTCGHCGTSFKLPETKLHCRGVSISGGSVTIGGNLVGGSMVVVGDGNSLVARADVARPSVILWDDSGDSDDEGILIDVENVQVFGDVVGGSVVKIVPPAKVEPARKLSWREKVKRLFAN